MHCQARCTVLMFEAKETEATYCLLQAKEAVAAMLKLAQQAGLHIVQGERLTCLSVLAADQVMICSQCRSHSIL